MIRIHTGRVSKPRDSSRRDSSRMEELFQTMPEQVEPVEATLQGHLPAWLQGSLLRNGPAVFEIGQDEYKHWFDGLGMLHKFHMSSGKVTYSSRYLRSEAFNLGQTRSRIAFGEFATPAPPPDPCLNIFSRFFSYFVPQERSDNCPVNVFPFGESYFALSESPFLVGFDPESLETLNTYDIRKSALGRTLKVFSMTPHPHKDIDGTIYNVVTSFGTSTTHNIVAFPLHSRSDVLFKSPLEDANVVASFKPHNQLAYHHSFGISENFFIFIELPFAVNLTALIAMKFTGNSFLECMSWDNKRPSLFYLIERKSGKCIAKYEADNFFCFHHVNAHETDTEVLVDVSCYPNAQVVSDLYLGNLRTKPETDTTKTLSTSSLRRYCLPIPTVGKVPSPSLQKLSDEQDYEVLHKSFDLPQINYDFANGRDYRFAYGVGSLGKTGFLDQLVKVDVVNKESKVWYEEDCHPSEPVFVTSPGAEQEDEGVVISSVVGTHGKSPFLLILDAESFQELARAVVPCPVSLSLHGFFQLKDILTD